MSQSLRVHAYSRYLIAVIAVLILSVFQLTAETVDVASTATHTNRPETLSPIQSEILEGCRAIYGRTSLTVRGKSFRYDCVGTVCAAYYYAGIDLESRFGKYTGNGVARLYAYAADLSRLTTAKKPEPGDIIFWDNTYDRNGDGKWNDELTHCGIVYRYYENGTIDYIHLNYAKGIILERMNLYYPDVDVHTHDTQRYRINSPMRMRSHRYLNPQQWLASHLFRAFGTIHAAYSY